MAAAAQEKLVKITINDIEIEVPQGELIVESVKRLGLEIPIFCYHPRMKPVGMCRMCLVEVGFKQQDGSVRKMPKPQAGCTLPASEGLVIFTDTEMVHRDRKGVLEFLLINHPLDCPICDRGGECPLQNNTLAYGPSTSRFTEMKRHLPKAYPLSKYVTLDLERCIQCGRCVRFTEEISGDSQLAFRFRGAEMQPSTFQLSEFESKFSGNVIEICPVGALTSTQYRFRARPWDLESAPAVCTVTPCGTNIYFDYRSGKFVRVNGRTNEAVNDEWTSDKTKFGHNHYNSESRLKAPNIRKGAEFAGAAWSEAYQSILAKFQDGGDSVGVIAGTTQTSNEAYYMLQKLFRKGFKSANIAHVAPQIPAAYADRLETKLGASIVNTKLETLDLYDSVLVFGTNLADEQPMHFLRVRKGWFQRGMKVVVAHHEPTDADKFAAVVLRYRPGTEEIVAKGLAGKASAEEVEAGSGVNAEKLKAAVALLQGNCATLTTHSLFSSSPAAAQVLSGVGRFSCLANGATQQGAIDLGILPDTLPGGEKSPNTGLGLKDMLEAAASGKIKALWLVNTDLLNEYEDRALVERALENVETLVVQHWMNVETAAYATIVLPCALPAEQDGTYMSSERRVQRIKQILPPPGEAKPAWRIFTECFLRIEPGVPAFNPGEIMEEIGREVPAFEAASYDQLEGEGVIVQPKQTAMAGDAN